MTHKIRILVAEDHLIARIGVIAILGMQPDMTVVAEAVNGQMALDKFRAERPDVALLDMKMPQMDGLEVLSKILQFDPTMPVVMVSFRWMTPRMAGPSATVSGVPPVVAIATPSSVAPIPANSAAIA